VSPKLASDASLEAKALKWSVGAALVMVPATILAIRALAGTSGALETIVGSVFAVAFMASTAVVALVFRDSESLKIAVLYSYVTKISLLASGALLLPLADLNRRTFAVSAVSSAAIYLGVQLAILGRAPRAQGKAIPWDNDGA